jgi:hypothetical protein
MKKKSTAETAEVFLCKDKRHKSFYDDKFLYRFRPSRDGDKRMQEEKAECAEIIP